jgi:hypothetical protein
MLMRKLFDGSDISIAVLMLPLLLLTIYPIIGVPAVLFCIAKDLLTKREGFLSWHRNSVGELLQRLFFSILLMTSFAVFTSCEN